MYRFIRPVLFRMQPERAHTITLGVLQLTGAFPPALAVARRLFAGPQVPVRAFGLDFANPVGLAAGYDKDAIAWRGLASLGFGHLELGTITPQPQAGNPPPRLFRLPDDRGLINRLGFPGRGADFAAQRLHKARKHARTILGINIGKNKDTPNQEAARDYLALLERFADLADYLAVNVSSPNTIGLRRLQARQALSDLLAEIARKRRTMASQPAPPGSKQNEPSGSQPSAPNPSDQIASVSGQRTAGTPAEPPRPPILVKLSPDLSDGELEDALDAIVSTGMDGVIATNTALRRPRLRSPQAGQGGGLSGAPLTGLANQMVLKIRRLMGDDFPIIGVGGIMTPDDARRRLDAGANLIQVYTGLIYAGPGLVKSILNSL